jgi:L,D-peptidoglycan transpeptidase YkuD (ErfK/YbiS/YcfS/YnhG family)
LENRANNILEILNGKQGPDYTAAWHYDQLCGESPLESIQWGLIPPASEQLLVVVTEDWNATMGTLQRKQRSLGGEWENVGEPVTVNVGRNGLAWGRGLHPFPGLTVRDHVCEGCTKPPAPKREGDGRAPAGLFRLGSTHYRPQEASLGQNDLLRLSAQAIPDGFFCEDRPVNPDYNHFVELSAEEQAECETIGLCPEPINREDGIYDALIWVEHNTAGSPGAGSCIFLHFQKGDGVPTAGCTSAPRQDLADIIGWLNPARVPLLLQLPRAEYEARKTGWVLPSL